MIGPPKDIDPAALFLLLLKRPRPQWQTDVGTVVAMTALERAGIQQATANASPSTAALMRSRYEVALCLHDESGPVFQSPDDVGDLKVSELRRLASQVSAALCVCCPEYGYCNVMAWHQRLMIGARLTPGIAGTLGSCLDDGPHRTVSRPDRWFGLPLSELTDGQWMAFRVGREYVEEQAKQTA